MARILVILVSLILFSCKESVPPVIGEGGVEATFTALLQEAMDNDHNNIAGISLRAKSELKGVDWDGTIGYDTKDKTKELQIDQPFRIASVTKTFVAVAILRLHEMDSLSIYDSIGDHISESHANILREDGYDLQKINILQCLNHTSGFYDYAMGGSPYIGVVQDNPKKRWTRTEQLEFAVKHGSPLGYPGEKYGYADTGYILLGEIIENYFDGDLGLGLRTLIGYEDIGISNTWLETLEPAPPALPRQVGRYLRSMDGLQMDPSTDLYGGGGLVSTIEDLHAFIKALFENRIFEKKSTLDLMLTKPEYDASYDTYQDRRYKDYRLGLWKIAIMGNEVYMHSGLWGSYIFYQPSTQTSMALNYTKGRSDLLIKKLFITINSINDL